MKTFIISAGHSDKDPGAVAAGVTEASIVTELRDLVAGALVVEGHTVFVDGDVGENKPLREALKLFVHKGAIAIEFHCNAAANPAARGIESIALNGSLKPLCQKLSKAIADVLGEPVRGDNGFIDPTKSARGKLAWCDAGGIIVETFFLSNPASLAKYKTDKKLVVDAIVKVLLEHAK